MRIALDAVEARILGSLVEKSLTTPELYPLTYNALLNACNQKSSRDPVMSLDADTLGKGIQGLLDKNLIERIAETGARVPKFRHRIDNLIASEDPKFTGLMTVLLLRGPQTPGELKSRSERLCQFGSTAEIEALLQELAARPEPVIARLPKQTGQKEMRYRELFSSGSEATSPAPAAGPAEKSAGPAPSSQDRLDALEKRVAALEAALAALKP